MLSSLTDRILQAAFEAFLTRNSELCDQVVAEDEEIDALEKQVDQDGVGLLIRFHPVASDMREVISAMKVSTNLERGRRPIRHDCAKGETFEFPTFGKRSCLA
jgi:phosphate transport system protein